MTAGGPDHPVVKDPAHSSFLEFPAYVRLVEPAGEHGGVTFPRGFLAGAAVAGLKESGSRDVGVLSVAPEYLETATSAAVFTPNAFCAAPVELSRTATEVGHLAAAVMNSGNANACTGEAGVIAARAMQAAAAGALGLPSGRVGLASTGIIGRQPELDKLISGVEAAVRNMSPQGGPEFAEAIRTTDRFAKECALELPLGAGSVRLAGAAKGAGMIAPGMATMLCAVTTDAVLAPELARDLLSHAVERSFNRITVDGQMSTNDSVFFLASGASGVELQADDVDAFRDSLSSLLLRLALMMVADGEGATKVVRFRVAGAESASQARAVCRAVADSPLVKTALYGRDPNWGRIIAAAGSAASGSRFPGASLNLNGVRLLENAAAAELSAAEERQVGEIMGGSEIDFVLDLNAGEASDLVYFSDLGHEYVTINADYHT